MGGWRTEGGKKIGKLRRTKIERVRVQIPTERANMKRVRIYILKCIKRKIHTRNADKSYSCRQFLNGRSQMYRWLAVFIRFSGKKRSPSGVECHRSRILFPYDFSSEIFVINSLHRHPICFLFFSHYTCNWWFFVLRFSARRCHFFFFLSVSSSPFSASQPYRFQSFHSILVYDSRFTSVQQCTLDPRFTSVQQCTLDVRFNAQFFVFR